MNIPENTVVMGRKKINLRQLINIQYVPPVFITLILLTGHFTFGILEGYRAILLSIGSSMLTELILARLLFGKWKNLIQCLYFRNQCWHSGSFNILMALCRNCRHLHHVEICIAFQKTHIWNPSNFGISWMLAVSPFQCCRV